MTTSRGHRRPGAMTSDVATVLAERGQRYGEFAGHASLTQALKAAMASGEIDLQTLCQEAAAAQKGAR